MIRSWDAGVGPVPRRQLPAWVEYSITAVNATTTHRTAGWKPLLLLFHSLNGGDLAGECLEKEYFPRVYNFSGICLL